MGHNRKTSFLLLSILIVFASTKINADEEDDDLEGFTLPSFTLHPIVDLLNKEEPSPPPPNDTDVDDSGVFDKISVGSLFSKFLRRPKGSKRLIPENATHEEVYIRLSHMLDQEIEVMIKEILPFALEYQQDRVNTTPRCSNSMLNFGAAMREKTSWAFKFLDSMGKIPSGLLEGTLSDFGNFDQCLDAEVTTEVSWIGVQPILYKGSYCLVEIEPPLPKIKDRLKYETVVLNYTNTELHTTFFNRWATYVHDYYSYPIAIGMCMPSTCTAKEVEKVMANVMRQYNMSVRVGPNCNSRDQVFEKSFPFFQISVILLIGGFVALASLHEYCAFSYEKPAKKKILTKVFHCFSLLSNTRGLLQTEEEKLYTGNETESLKYEVTLQSLHGIKVITLMWVVIVDVYLMGGLPLSNLIKNSYTDFKLRGRELMFQFIINGWGFSAETFLFLSAVLVTYNAMKIMEKRKKFIFLKYIFFRWVRLAPAVLGTLLLAFILFNPNFGSGPIFERNALEITSKCESNWWSNIFFLNNWFKVDNMCLQQTWILSVGFQLYFLAFFVIVAIYKAPVLGFIMTTLLILVGIVVPGFVTFLYKLPPTFILDNPYIKQVKEDLEINFFPTFNHFTPYFVGVLVGYLIFKKKQALNKNMYGISVFAMCLLVCVLCALSLCTILFTINWNSLTNYPDEMSSMIYAAVHRLTWILGVASLAYNICIFKGIISKLLSLKIFVVLSRLSLHIYLNHFLIIWYYFFTRRTLIVYRDVELITIAMALFLASLAVSIVTYMIFDAPFRALLYLLSQYKIQNFLTHKTHQDTENNITSGVVNPLRL